MSLKPGRVQSGVPLGVDGIGRRVGDVRTRAISLPARHPPGTAMLALTVTHNDVEFALRRLKRQLQKSGLLRGTPAAAVRKTSERRRRRQREGIRQTRTRARLAHG